MLSARRPGGFDVAPISLTEILAAKQITWIVCSKALWCHWIIELDRIWLEDHRNRSKAAKANADQKEIHNQAKNA